MKAVKGLENRTQEEEMKLAKEEKRQPFCVHCTKPLDRISQTQYEFIDWEWDRKRKRYCVKTVGGDSDKPFCANCEAKDWEFIDFGLVDF